MSSINDTDRTTKWRKADIMVLGIATANLAHRDGITLFRALKKAQELVFNFLGQPERIKEDLTSKWEPAAEVLKKAKKKLDVIDAGEVPINWKAKLHEKKK
jgi:hypothetical protein